MSVKELMDFIVAAVGDLQELCKSYIGAPYTACTVEEFSHRCFLILERYNLHLRKVLGIELYLIVGANFDDFNTISGYLKFRKAVGAVVEVNDNALPQYY